MPSWTPILISGSTDGKPVLVAETTTPGTTVHAASGGGTRDYLSLEAYNGHTGPVDLTLEWGGVTDPDHLMPKALTIAPGSSVTLCTRRPIQNSLAVKAFASVASKILISQQLATRYTP